MYGPNDLLERHLAQVPMGALVGAHIGAWAPHAAIGRGMASGRLFRRLLVTALDGTVATVVVGVATDVTRTGVVESSACRGVDVGAAIAFDLVERMAPGTGACSCATHTT